MAVTLVLILVLASVFATQDVNAKRMTKRGVYINTQKKISIKVTSRKIVIKGPMKYGKKRYMDQSKYKKTRKGKKTFILDENVKYYVGDVGYSRRSEKDAKAIMKDIGKYPGSVYLRMYMKNKKVYKIIFSQ